MMQPHIEKKNQCNNLLFSTILQSGKLEKPDWVWRRRFDQTFIQYFCSNCIAWGAPLAVPGDEEAPEAPAPANEAEGLDAENDESEVEVVEKNKENGAENLEGEGEEESMDGQDLDPEVIP